MGIVLSVLSDLIVDPIRKLLGFRARPKLEPPMESIAELTEPSTDSDAGGENVRAPRDPPAPAPAPHLRLKRLAYPQRGGMLAPRRVRDPYFT